MSVDDPQQIGSVAIGSEAVRFKGGAIRRSRK
jgi:hypothetical protein